MHWNAAAAQEEFFRALQKGRVQALLSKLQLERSELLSFYDIKELVKPKRETYVGTRPIEVSRIIGSEGRFNDFSNEFLPRRHMLKGRWTRISTAHHGMVLLPPISVYKLGNAYFVRDGNHRVSVAKANRVEFIDADIVELDSQIRLEPGMTDRQIRDQVIAYERERVLSQTGIADMIDMDAVVFTAPGQYTEMLHHIQVHKYYINMDREQEIPFETAVKSWYEHVYLPVAEAVVEENLGMKFPGRTTGDLYMWVVKHWNRMKDDSSSVDPLSASRDYAVRNRLPLGRWTCAWLKKKLGKFR
jgi:hypothetical protein